jgi:hypothetical protein
VPAGPCDVVITNGGTALVYIGEVTTGMVTTSNGLPLASGGVMSFLCYQGSPGGTLEVITTAGSATLGVLGRRRAPGLASAARPAGSCRPWG